MSVSRANTQTTSMLVTEQDLDIFLVRLQCCYGFHYAVHTKDLYRDERGLIFTSWRMSLVEKHWKWRMLKRKRVKSHQRWYKNNRGDMMPIMQQLSPFLCSCQIQDKIQTGYIHSRSSLNVQSPSCWRRSLWQKLFLQGLIWTGSLSLGVLTPEWAGFAAGSRKVKKKKKTRLSFLQMLQSHWTFIFTVKNNTD